MPPATGTAAGMAVSAATASSSEAGSVTDCAVCGACVVNPLPLPGCPGTSPSATGRRARASGRTARLCVGVPYVLTGRTWQLWHMFRAVRSEGPRAPPSGGAPGSPGRPGTA
ncbi:hypothetical protein Shyd_21110 [Streptomyces hydrogenans]|uniref:4Fe-4S ferredoxin-type domain-containing protein n=1 Tax=Streptomyces hydrogenans TaxID=1873719 RepID=A0ABQ3P6V2_9ACTN|nr:hypothetical protein GCM10018784_12950 [Streptomyces hydrogenans]GHI20740.1 hypothetical protein Shyd_21110 [Streptomyces hydrogenans]